MLGAVMSGQLLFGGEARAAVRAQAEEEVCRCWCLLGWERCGWSRRLLLLLLLLRAGLAVLLLLLLLSLLMAMSICGLSLLLWACLCIRLARVGLVTWCGSVGGRISVRRWLLGWIGLLLRLMGAILDRSLCLAP